MGADVVPWLVVPPAIERLHALGLSDLIVWELLVGEGGRGRQ